MTDANPKVFRRRSFGLRTLFVLMMVLAFPLGWAAYSARWIKQRHAVFERWAVRAVPPIDGSVRAPAGLWLLGEEGVGNLWCWNMPDDEFAEVVRLFPESKIAGFSGGSKDLPEWWEYMGTPR